MKNNRPKAILIGFNELFYDGLKMLLHDQEIDLLAYAQDKKQILFLLKSHQPEVAMIDIDSPDFGEFEMAIFIKNSYPSIGVVAFCASCDDQQIIHVLEAGARGVIFHQSNKREIIKGIKTVASKKRYYSPAISKKLLNVVVNRFDPKTNLNPKFTSREISIIKLICKEYTNKAIAEKLSLSIRTVEEHRTNILKKADAKNAVGIALYAIRHKIIK